MLRSATIIMLWLMGAACVSMAVPDEIVYVTKAGKKYHRSSCPALRGEKIAISLSEAVKKYQPCKRCNPPTVIQSFVSDNVKDSTKVVSERSKIRTQRCQAITKKGTRCKRMAMPGSKYCRQHQEKNR